MPKLFWSAPAGPAGNVVSLINAQGQLPVGAQAALVDGSDISYPAPGGGLLRVPVGGGNAAQLLGSGNGQLVFWDATAGQWVPTTVPTDGTSAVWNAALNAYAFQTVASPSQLQYFDTTLAPVGLWIFNNTLVDSSGNGLDLSAEAGAAAFCPIVPGKQALYMPLGSRFGRAAGSINPLLLRGALTLQFIVQMDTSPPNAPATSMCLASVGGPGETAPNNFLWSISLQTTITTYVPINLATFWEFGAGTDVFYFTTGPASLPPIHNIIYVAMTRNGATGNVQYYVNGKPFNAGSGVKTLPGAGEGSTAKLQFGTDSSAGTVAQTMALFSAKVNDVELSAAQILAEYNRTMGPAFGVLT